MRKKSVSASLVTGEVSWVDTRSEGFCRWMCKRWKFSGADLAMHRKLARARVEAVSHAEISTGLELKPGLTAGGGGSV